MKNKDTSSFDCNNRRRQSNKCFCNFCNRLGYNIETCYQCNKSVVSISVATVANIGSIQPMAPISAKSKSFGSTIIISTIDLQNIITNTICMVGNASYSFSLLVTSGMCHVLNPIPEFVTMTGMLISSLNLVLTRTN